MKVRCLPGEDQSIIVVCKAYNINKYSVVTTLSESTNICWFYSLLFLRSIEDMFSVIHLISIFGKNLMYHNYE